MYKRICKNCDQVFYTKFSHKKYCSVECRKKITAYNNKERAKEMIIIAKEIGNCSRCWKVKDDPRYLMCLKCRKYTRENQYQKSEKKEELKRLKNDTKK